MINITSYSIWTYVSLRPLALYEANLLILAKNYEIFKILLNSTRQKNFFFEKM